SRVTSTWSRVGVIVISCPCAMRLPTPRAPRRFRRHSSVAQSTSPSPLAPDLRSFGCSDAVVGSLPRGGRRGAAMGSLGATRGARPRAHVGVAVAAALAVLLVVGLLIAAQTRRWRSTARRDALVTRSALRDDLDATT